MAIQKRPYELSVWVEKLNGSHSKIEEKGVIIGAHDMSYPGRATNLVLKREIKGTNTLTFQMPDKYFDSLTGEYVRNEFIDAIFPECKLKLYYKDRWFEFFVKKVDEKKQFKSYMKTFTCSDAFIDELSRNGYGITYDTELYNNVEEIGTFAEGTLDDSIWQYHPEHNWGDFTEYKEEKLYRIPISQFGGTISAYKLKFNLTKNQMETLKDSKKDTITNLFTGDERVPELSDDISRGLFWDQYTGEAETENPLEREFHSNIDNDGYIYVPYSCLSFCYGQAEEPDFSKKLCYDRAATETAIEVNGNLLLAPPSVDPRTIIQFYVIPKNAVIELDDAGVILNKDYTFFMTLDQWNHAIVGNDWYMFEDTRLVEGEVLGSADVAAPTISHTFKYLKKNAEGVFNTDWESRGNKVVTYDGYLSDINGQGIIKGKKFSITNRTELNISKDIDQYVTVYNAKADDFADEYTNEDWAYSDESETTSGEKYRVCSKTATRQIIPQLARNLVQNGTDMDSTDGWSPMSYLLGETILLTPSMILRGVSKENSEEIYTAAIDYSPAMARVGQIWELQIPASLNKQETLNKLTFYYDHVKYSWGGMDHTTVIAEDKSDLSHDFKSIISLNIIDQIKENKDTIIEVVSIGTDYYLIDPIEKDNNGVARHVSDMGQDKNPDGSAAYPNYAEITIQTKDLKEKKVIPQYFRYLWSKNDWIQQGLKSVGIEMTNKGQFKYCSAFDNSTTVAYRIENGTWKKDSYKDETVFKQERSEIELRTAEIDEHNGQNIVNFGIIGQEKKIEKDKIYCLGVSAHSSQNFKIKIGKGALISEGQYTLVDDNYLEFSVGEQADIVYQLDKNDLKNQNDTKKNLIIDTLPETKYILFKSDKEIENPYFIVEASQQIILFKLFLFEAYTKGRDCFADTNLHYRYSGRDLFWPPAVQDDQGETIPVSTMSRNGSKLGEFVGTFNNEIMHQLIIFEDDIMLGSTYGYQQYFIQRLKAENKNKKVTSTYDTMGHKSFISSDIKELNKEKLILPLDAAQFTDDDYVIETNYIDLNKCKYYNREVLSPNQCDCKYGDGHTCYYQKFGYCPFRFKTEKHDRRIRTLSISKSNRFNIIQETSKVFEVYPQFYIDHKSNGSVLKDEEGEYLKKVFFITEKGRENKIGFRYEKNLKDISRNVVSDQIVTKLYVLDVDSELSKTGLCSIKTAEDNPSKDSYVIDLSYYIEKGMLEKEEVEQDLYGITPSSKDLTGQLNEVPSGFLYQLGYYNKQYDDLSNKIINLQDASYTELEANLTVNYQGMITAQEQLLKIQKQLDTYKRQYDGVKVNWETDSTFLNYKSKLSEQQAILTQLIYTTFFTDGVCDVFAFKDADDNYYSYLDEKKCKTIEEKSEISALEFFNCIKDLEESKKYWLDKRVYSKGILGQYNKEYMQIQQWKRERASYLKLINQISTAFYRKYEPYLKEGTWSDSNYLTDNAYYFGALDVTAEGAIPKVTYSISVIDLAPLSEEYDDIYDFDLADVTYVEDIGMFGIDKHTGLPNRLKTLISAFSEGLDDPSKDTITVQNFTTSFQDLFQQVTASVQSLTYNENIYKRSSNFTSLQNISNGSLQGALDTNELTLLDTEENNIKVDNTGTSGSDINNHANKYKLDGQGLFFSNDGGQHWSVGVGPSGINADYIKVGTLDAGKIRIADSQYVYFAWDKDGIVAYRDPQGVNTSSSNIADAAIFNKFGLSILNNGNIRLRAGYSYNAASGEIEKEPGGEIGFYLYNSNQEVIFSTTSSNAESAEDRGKETAALRLVGEMLVTNSADITAPAQTFYSKPVQKQAISLQYFSSSQYKLKTFVLNSPTDGMTINDSSGLTSEELACYVFNYGNINNFYFRNQHYILSGNINDQGQCWLKLTSEDFIYANKKILNYDIISKETLDDGSEIEYKNSYTQTCYKLKNLANVDSIIIDDYTQVLTIARYTLLQEEEVTGAETDIQNIGDCIVEQDGATHITSSSMMLYTVNGKTYSNKGTRSSGTTINGGKVALYLNNKEDVSKPTQKSSRLFTCCVSGTNNVRNLFSILKSGALYIGGNITGNQDPSNLSDTIAVSNPYIEITENGQFIIDFNQVQSPDPDPQNRSQLVSLTTYISRELNRNATEMRTFIDNVIGERTSGLASSGDRGLNDGRVHRDGGRNPSRNVASKNGPGSGDFGGDATIDMNTEIVFEKPGGMQPFKMTIGDLADMLYEAAQVSGYISV